MKKTKNQKYSASMLLQGILFGLFLIFFLWILYKPISKYYVHEEPEHIMTLTPQKIIFFGGDPIPILVGLYIHGFPEFNITKDTFIIDLTIWFRFNPKRISLKRVGDFTFEKARIIKKIKTHSQLEGDKLFVRYFMRISLVTKLNFKFFPFEDHRISLSLMHQGLSPREAIFETSRSNLIINPNIKITGWKIVDKSARMGYIEDKIDVHKGGRTIYYPILRFSLYFARVGIRHIITIIIPLLLIFFMFLLTLTFNPKKVGLIRISVGLISVAMAQRFIMQHLSPSPGYLMISDSIFLFVLLSSCIILLINTFSVMVPSFYKNIITIVFYIALMVLLAYLFFPLL